MDSYVLYCDVLLLLTVLMVTSGFSTAWRDGVSGARHSWTDGRGGHGYTFRSRHGNWLRKSCAGANRQIRM